MIRFSLILMISLVLSSQAYALVKLKNSSSSDTLNTNMDISSDSILMSENFEDKNDLKVSDYDGNWSIEKQDNGNFVYCNKVKNTLNVEMVDYIGYKVFENDVFIFYEIKDEINTTIPKYTFGTVYDILNKHTIYGGSINTKIINMFKKNEHLCFLSAMNQGEKYNIPITFYKNISSSEINFTRYFGPKREGEKKYIKLNQNYKKDSNYNCRFLVFSNNISVGNENNTEICFNAEKNVAYLYISGINILYVDNIYI